MSLEKAKFTDLIYPVYSNNINNNYKVTFYRRLHPLTPGFGQYTAVVSGFVNGSFNIYFFNLPAIYTSHEISMSYRLKIFILKFVTKQLTKLLVTFIVTSCCVLYIFLVEYQFLPVQFPLDMADIKRFIFGLNLIIREKMKMYLNLRNEIQLLLFILRERNPYAGPCSQDNFN